MALNLLHANQQFKSSKIYHYTVITFESLLDIINEHPTISKITLEGLIIDYIVVELVHRFVSEHPLIEGLEMYFDKTFTADEANKVIKVIRDLESLNLFVFRVKDQSECDRLLNQLGNQWKNNISIYLSYIKIELSCFSKVKVFHIFSHSFYAFDITSVCCKKYSVLFHSCRFFLV